MSAFYAGRPVLILGATSDIGIAIARGFAADGCPLQLAARNPDALEADCSDIAIRHDVEISTHRLDMLNLDGAAALFEALPTRPAVVVCVVGAMGDQSESETDWRAAQRVVETNFTGPMVYLEEAARRLSSVDADTAIVGISSVAGDRGRAKNYWYGAAKAGMTAALSGLRQKYAAQKLRVVTVKPGFVATKMTRDMALPPMLTSSPEEIATLIISGLRKGKRVIYPFRWWIVMLIIRCLPERVFERTRF